MCTSGSDNNTMLTSANQYLRPEYLPPVSSPLDANKSPLALLAKTCSSIGVDTPSVKSLTGSSSSNSSSSSSANSSSNERRTTPKSKSTDPTDASKLNFKPYELSSNKSKSSHNDGEKSAAAGKTTPTASASHKARGSSPGNASQNSPDLQKQQATTNSSSSSAPLSYTSLGLPDMHKDSLAAFYKAYGFLSPNCCPTTPGSPYGSLMPPPITLDKTGAYPSIYPPTPSATAAAALAAYSNYSNFARMKSGMAGGGSSMGHLPGATNPLCRDPYCLGACSQFGQHNSHAAAASLLAASQANMVLRESAAITSMAGQSMPQCPNPGCNGCSQCEQHRYLAAIAAAYGGSFPGLTSAMPYPQMSASYASSLATAAALHHQHRAAQAGAPICSWVDPVSNIHCGRRFSTPEELLIHLKSHTASSQNPESRSSPSTASSNAPSTAHQSTSNSPAVSQHQSGTHSPRHSSNSNGTAVSPSLHSNRFHPYSNKPISSMAASLPPTALSSASFSLGPNGVGASPYPGPFGLPPGAASNLYYPYLFSGRIGPPVPP